MHNAAIERHGANDSPFTAQVGLDPALNSTVISLLYEDKANPARSITVGIAPDLGSNMFRLRVGTHDIIYCEPDLLTRRAFTGNFVLWPLPNRVRDKRYVYQGQTYSLEALKRPGGNEVLIHGLVFDRQWHYDQPVIGHDAVSVTTYVDITHESPFYQGYPFESRLSLTFVLTNTMSPLPIVCKIMVQRRCHLALLCIRIFPRFQGVKTRLSVFPPITLWKQTMSFANRQAA